MNSDRASESRKWGMEGSAWEWGEDGVSGSRPGVPGLVQRCIAPVGGGLIPGTSEVASRIQGYVKHLRRWKDTCVIFIPQMRLRC